MLNESFAQIIKTVTNLTGVSQEDFTTLKNKSQDIASWKGEIVSLFYNALYTNSSTQKVFKEGEREEREKMLGGWLEQLISVNNDEEFWRIQGKIAFAHVKRHVYNEYMVSISSRLQEFFWEKAIQNFSQQEAIQVGQAFTRIINTVVGITVGLYDLIIAEVTGASPELIDNLIESSLEELQQEFSM